MTISLRRQLLLAILAALIAASPAAAQNRSAYVPGGLTGTVETPHFVVHFNPSASSPVAGLRAPTSRSPTGCA